jgi:hypothetical protein
MNVRTPSGNTTLNTKNIDAIFFQMKRDKNDKVYKRNGTYIVDKTKIDIIFSSGHAITLTALNEEEGQKVFDIISSHIGL